MLGNVKLDLR